MSPGDCDRFEWPVLLGPLQPATVRPHQFGRRYRLTSLNNSGFRGLQHPGELAGILILGEVLEPHSLVSPPGSLAAEGRHPRAIRGGEHPRNDDQGRRAT